MSQTLSIIHISQRPATDTKKLFNEFEKDNGITIEDAVVDDIWARSNG
jgi:hypothetical protein